MIPNTFAYNGLLFHRKEASREELFQSLDRGYLKPLPSSCYQLKNYSRAKVQKMRYVYFSPDKTYYSVPYRHISSKETQIHYTDDWIEVYHYHERIASHRRNPVKGAYITIKDHLSSTHKAYSEWSPSFFEKKRSNMGSLLSSLSKACLPIPIIRKSITSEPMASYN